MNLDSPQQMQQEEEEEEEEQPLKAQIRELEQDLAQTKLKMVEAKCRIQVGAENLAVVCLEGRACLESMDHVITVWCRSWSTRRGSSPTTSRKLRTAGSARPSPPYGPPAEGAFRASAYPEMERPRWA